MRWVRFLLRWLAAACLLLAGAASAAPWDSLLASSPNAPGKLLQASLVSRTATIPPSGALDVGILLRHQPGAHSYWINPGSAGFATSVRWTLPPGASASPLAWPAPSAFPVGKQVSWGYGGETLLAAQVRLPPGSGRTTLRARVSWLACKELCVPGEANLSLTLPAGDGAPGALAPVFDKAAASLPQPGQGLAAYLSDSGTLEVSVPGKAADTLALFPLKKGVIASATPQKTEGGVLAVRTVDAYRGAPFAAVVTGNGGPDSGGWAILADFAPQAAPLPRSGAEPGSGSALTWLPAVAMAFLGGVILNLMPCVFPVLSLKVLSLVKTSRATLARHGVAFAAGTLLTMLGLALALAALKAAGQRVGWGFQLQQPAVVAALTLLFAAITLNLAGLFEVTVSAQGRIHAKGAAESFLTGVLAVFVASPCTAPFMGAALGYAATQPTAQSIPVFLALGAGLAAPWCLVTWVPALATRLPRPGPWMDIFRKAMAVPMALAALWLLWVFRQQAGDRALLLLAGAVALLAAALWLLGRRQWGKASPRFLAPAAAAAAVALAVAASLPGAASAPQKALQGWQPWSKAAVAQAVRDGKGAFVDFTAAWCLTCQVNERVIFGRDDVSQALRDSGLVLMVADWTNQDPEIAAEIARLGRSGVPLYVVHHPDGRETLLPEVPLPGDVIQAVGRPKSPAAR